MVFLPCITTLKSATCPLPYIYIYIQIDVSLLYSAPRVVEDGVPASALATWTTRFLPFTFVALQINVKIKIVSGSPCGAVAAETKRAQANWVVLDK